LAIKKRHGLVEIWSFDISNSLKITSFWYNERES